MDLSDHSHPLMQAKGTASGASGVPASLGEGKVMA